MRFLTVEGRIGGGFLGAYALGAEPLPPQQAADPFVGHRGQQLSPSAKECDEPSWYLRAFRIAHIRLYKLEEH